MHQRVLDGLLSLECAALQWRWGFFLGGVGVMYRANLLSELMQAIGIERICCAKVAFCGEWRLCRFVAEGNRMRWCDLSGG